MKRHDPVLLKEIIELLSPSMEVICDGTLGHGGHTKAMIERMREFGVKPTLIGFDRDDKIASRTTQELASDFPELTVVNDSYAEILAYVQKQQRTFDFILLDIGVNMEHFTDGERGFSINTDAPLDMRFSPRTPKTAADIINNYKPDQLDLLFQTRADASPKLSQRLTLEIVRMRSKKKIMTTFALLEVLGSIGVHKMKAAPYFQALRIEVNDEMGELQKFLRTLPQIMAPAGKCAIITYHSGEDRIVKNAFKELADLPVRLLDTKHVIKPHYLEVQRNKAARSAKLRIITYTGTDGKI